MADTPSSRTGPDCLNCWKYEDCGKAQPGTFCPQWQSKPPQPKGKDPNEAWRKGEDAPF